MKLRLENFLCYKDGNFDFGEKGIALLSGMSGSGKTSIFRAIFFALFGEGNKLVTYGKTSCKVELEFDGIKISRTKRPNRLVVNDIYEDDSAQDIINKKFGDTFKTSGYIQQNNISSFILMSPIEKLSFLEKFAFRDVNLGKIKGRCKSHISKCHDELISITSQLSMSKEVLDKLDTPTKVKFPIKCKIIQREKAIKNENIKHKNCITLIKKARSVIKQTSKELISLKVLEATLQSRKETQIELSKKIKNLKEDIDSCKYEGDDQIALYKTSLENIIKSRDINNLEEQLKDNLTKLSTMKVEEILLLTRKNEKMKNELWKEYTKEDLEETILDLKEYISDLEDVKELNREIETCNIDKKKYNKHKEDLEKYIIDLEKTQKLYTKVLAQKEIYSCPSCKVNLRILDTDLIIVDSVSEDNLQDSDSIKERINELKTIISKLQRIIPTEEDKIDRKRIAEDKITNIIEKYNEITKLEDIKEDLQYLRDYKTSQLRLEKKIKEHENSIKHENLSASYNSFREYTENIKTKINNMKKNLIQDNQDLSEEELREKISEQLEIKNKLSQSKERYDECNKTLEKCNSVINTAKENHINRYEDIKIKEQLEIIIKEKTNFIREQQEKFLIHKENLIQIENWKKYQEDLEKYQKWIDKTTELTNKEKEARKKYAASTELKEKILEAESIAMINIIDSINTHARVYLDSFFVENPISVQLQAFKTTKKNIKPSINIAIEYKGMEADMNMLSGGELSRVILAYTLSLAEMFNTPLLLLDECTASLDQELTCVVFDSIRDNFNGKMTLIIAHQIIKGQFDKVVTLSN